MSKPLDQTLLEDEVIELHVFIPVEEENEVIESLFSNIDVGIMAVKMMEISSASLKNDGKVIQKVQLTVNSDENKFDWVTLGSGAWINREALVEPVIKLGNLQVVGCLSGYSSDPINFVKQYPFLPTVAFNSLDELKKHHKADKSLMYYYPTVPSKKTDETSLDLLKHFPNCLLMREKPSHNSAAEAKAFRQSLVDNKINENRFIVGMHSFLHELNLKLLELVKEKRDEIESVYIVFNCPNNPYDLGR